MIKRIKDLLRKIKPAAKDESGQALVEYALLISLTTGVFILFFNIFTSALGGYYSTVVQYLSLPFP